MSKEATFAGNYFINTGIMVSGGMKKEIEVFDAVNILEVPNLSQSNDFP